MAECVGQEEIQVQYPVGGADEGAGGPPVQSAEHAVLPLGEPEAEPITQTGLSGVRGREHEGNGQTADTQVAAPVAVLHQAVGEAVEHGLIREGDGDVQNQIFGVGPGSGPESGEPPVAAADGEQAASFVEQLHGHGQQFAVRHALEERMLILAGGKYAVRPVDADLRAHIDAVLSFPEFDHPGSAVMTEIDRFAVKYHLKMDGSLVEK